MSDKQVRAQYTRELKLEAVRQVRSGQAIAVVSKVLGIPKASLGNWVRLSPKGELDGATVTKPSWRAHRGIRVGKDRVRKLIQQHGIKDKTKRKFVATTDSRHSLSVAPDLVQRRFNPEKPNRLWCGDITYIQTDEGWLYLAGIIGLFSRQVVGWSLQPHMQASLVKDALAMAWWRRRPPPGLIFHSGRGSQHGSPECQQALKDWGMHSSMSRKGHCWDNAPTESFWGRLKTASVHGHKFATPEQARQAVLNWMAFYNHRRLHRAGLPQPDAVRTTQVRGTA